MAWQQFVTTPAQAAMRQMKPQAQASLIALSGLTGMSMPR
jgi:hypothetical protein